MWFQWTLMLLVCCCFEKRGTSIKLKDYFIRDEIALDCPRQRHHRQSNSVVWKFTSFKRSARIRSYLPGKSDFANVEVVVTKSLSQLKIGPLMVNDSGRYDCIKPSGNCSWKINVHDPENMVYVMISRGQAPWTDTVLSRYRVALHWGSWTECDGCGGNGERRKFGFCYITWLDKKVHCTDSKEVPILLRSITKRRREEVIVDICFDHCVELEAPVTVEEQRVDLANGADITLTCIDDADVTDPIRWERESEVLKRIDVSFGYSKTQPVYVTKTNRLVLRNIRMPMGGIIRLSCVEHRKNRLFFNLYVQALPGINRPTFNDHLFWIAASSTVQITAFLLLLLVYTTLQNFVRAFSLSR